MSQSSSKKALIALVPLAALVVLGIILFVYVKNVNNNLVKQEEQVKAAWSQVANQYQRRQDLVPNLARAVQAYAGHERETLLAVMEARAQATRATVRADSLNPAALQAFQTAQEGLGGALSRLLVSVESYPALRASEQFTTLQVQLEGTENRIAVERMRFNESARDYNTALRAFPANIVASLFGFEQYPYFKAEAGAEQAPQLDFSN